MKIGINAQFLDTSEPTGIHILTRGIVYGLNRIDSENEYVLYTDKIIPNPGFPLKNNFKFKYVRSIPGFSSIYWMQFRLPLEVFRDNIDIMLFPDHRTFMVWKPCKTAAVLLDIGFVFFPKSFTWSTKWKFRMLTYGAVHRSDHLLSISESTKNDVMKYYDIPGDKIDIVYAGCDTFSGGYKNTANDTAVLEQLGLEPGFLLYVGVFQPRKNIKGLLEAFKLFKQKEKGNMRLVLAGQKGWLFDEVVNFLKTDEVCLKYVKWLEHMTDEQKWVLYRNARSLVFPSFYEGFGIPALEAMSCGTPVLYANRSSLPEVVKDAGISFDPLNTEEIALQMERIVADDGLYKTLKTKSLTRAKEFTWEKTADKILSSFKTIIQK